MPEVKSVLDADVNGKRVLVRVVLNVPLQNGVVSDDTRLRAVVPTIEALHRKGASQITIFGYVGRPDGKVVEELRVAPVAKRLHELTSVPFEALENVRFDPREEINDPELAKEYAAHGDVFVSDAFADSHRAYASTVGVTKFLPSYAGLQLMSEIEHLSLAITPPAGSVALIALTKNDKLPLVTKLASLYSKVLVGGPVPVDFVPPAANIVPPIDGIPQRAGLLDIGPLTLTAYLNEIESAPFVLWNGPLGWYEKGYTESTTAIAEKIITRGVKAVIGGGDTINALKNFQFDPAKVFLSTGGGAMLEFLSSGTLPAIEALRN